jgi:DNA-binding transcriptional MerR regulator
MYSIGQFSIMTKISAKTLRYYDEINLLKPSKVDGENNYRYYDDDSLVTAQQIQIYKSCEMPLERIKEILIMPQEKNSLKDILISQLNFLDKKLIEIHKSHSVLQNIIKTLEVQKMEQVKLRDHEKRKVLSIRERGTHDSIGNIISRLFETASKLNLKVTGPHTIIWLEDKDFNQESIEMEIYIPIDNCIDIHSDLIITKEHQQYCEIDHCGTMTTLSSAYSQIYSFIQEHKLVIAGPFEETYGSNIKFIDPNDLKINVAVPVQEAI